MCPKLTPAHIYLPLGAYMRIKLAAQVFSNSVAVALKCLTQEGYFTEDEAGGAIEIVSKMNKLFDYCNAEIPFMKSSKSAISCDMLQNRPDDLQDLKVWMANWKGICIETQTVRSIFMPFQKVDNNHKLNASALKGPPLNHGF